MRAFQGLQRQRTGYFIAPVLLGQPMEDFLFQEAISGKAAGLIGHDPIDEQDQDAVALWQTAAEECVLARIRSLRIVGGLPLHKSHLSGPDRLSRLQAVLKLWANGCVCAVDEELFADILRRAERPA